MSFFNPFVNMFNFGTLAADDPKLKFCLAESAIGWIPFVVQEMDYRYKRQFERKKAADIPLKSMPSEIFKRQVWATYQTDLVGLALDPLLWRRSHHVGIRLPASGQHMAVLEGDHRQGLGHLSPEMKKKVIHDNAAALYGLGKLKADRNLSNR